MQGQGMQTSYVYTPTTSSARPGFASRTAKMLGVLQVILGILCIIFQIIAIFVLAGAYYIGTGIWTGIFMVLAGGFGIAAGQKKTNCFIISFMVLSIIASFMSGVFILISTLGMVFEDLNSYNNYYRRTSQIISFMILSIIASCMSGVFILLSTLGMVFEDLDRWNDYHRTPLIITFMVMSILAAVFSMMPIAMGGLGIEMDRDGYYFYHDDYYYSPEGGRLALDGIMLVLGLLEMAAAIWSSAICCKATCCLPGMGDPYSVPYHVQYVPASTGQQPVMLISPPSGQPGVVYAIPQSAANPQFVVQGPGTTPGQPTVQQNPQGTTYPGGPGIAIQGGVNQPGEKL